MAKLLEHRLYVPPSLSIFYWKHNITMPCSDSTLRWIARLCKEVRLQQNANRIKKRKLAGLRAEKRKMQARLRLVEGLLR